MTCSSSILTITLISLDKMLSIALPFSYNIYRFCSSVQFNKKSLKELMQMEEMNFGNNFHFNQIKYQTSGFENRFVGNNIRKKKRILLTFRL